MKLSTAGTPTRRPQQRQVIEGIAQIVGNLTIPVRERIMAEALRHVGNCGEYEISRIVAKNLRVSERVVDAVVMTSYLEERSRRAALETGIRSTVEMAAEAGRAVWQEIRGAA